MDRRTMIASLFGMLLPNYLQKPNTSRPLTRHKQVEHEFITGLIDTKALAAQYGVDLK